MARDDVVERLRAGGILAPRMVIEEAKRAGLRLDYACAMLQKESNGGQNVFGHDKTIFIGAGQVTKAKYLDYKRKRVASGNKLMQGIGPAQLTYWSLQDRADAQGGCWKPRINMRVGFKHLADHINRYGESDGARRYNGVGDAAVLYSKDLLAKAAQWRGVLDGAAPVVVASGPQPIKLGTRGPEVVRLTRRLSRLRSKAGTPYLDKPRKKLDEAAEGALKTFQSEHRLVADGVFGPISQRKLNRALRLQAKRAKEAGKQKEPATSAPASTTTTGRPAKRGRTLKSLVVAVHEADAETGEAWDALVAHAARRRRVLARETAKVAARPPEATTVIAEGFAAVTQALKKIDGTLDGIAEDLETQAEARVATVAAAVPAMTGGGGGGDAPPVEAGDGATVVQTAPPEPPPNEGPAPPSPAAAAPAAEPRRRELVDLSDDELLDRIARLDRALDRSRAVLIRRYVEVEKDLARLAPERKEEKASTKAEPKRKVKPAPSPEPVRPGRQKLTNDKVRELQTALNAFSEKHLVGMGPLIVDGVMGPATKKRIRLAKHYLGYTGTARKTAAVDDELITRLRHPRSLRHSSARMISRATRRRRKQRKAAKLSRAPRAGVDTFDGRPVAAWMKPYLEWAREQGWKGTLNSGWRDPVHSERLCFDLCNAPKCSGTCAGRSSNHVGNIKPAGSIDVSDPATFGALMKRCPYEPKIFNALGARDPWHFSASGR
jgi:peptidoglycan hydrolase-like protein with peptidoglycan-binding domain